MEATNGRSSGQEQRRQGRQRRLDGEGDQEIVPPTAIGILSQARILSSIEFLDLLSALRLGVEVELIKNMKRNFLNELLVTTQPAHIQKLHGRHLTSLERDEFRANMVRETLSLN